MRWPAIKDASEAPRQLAAHQAHPWYHPIVGWAKGVRIDGELTHKAVRVDLDAGVAWLLDGPDATEREVRGEIAVEYDEGAFPWPMRLIWQ